MVTAQNPDSIDLSPSWHQNKVLSTILVPSLLIGTGIATMNDRGFYSSQDAFEGIQRKYPDFHTTIDDYLMILPAAGVYGLNMAGIKGKNNFSDRSFIYLISFSLATITTVSLKNMTGVLRPDGSTYNSLPSGHTSIAFASATFLYEEYKDKSIWYGIGGYTIATATGILRMLNNRHWMSDVFVGAGIGILSTKIVYLVYPRLKDHFSSATNGRNSNNLSFTPQVYHNYYGLSFQLILQ